MDYFERHRVGSIEVDIPTRTVTVDTSSGAEELQLTRLEFDLLVTMARSSGRPVTRAVLLDAVWGRSNEVSEHAIETVISGLRSKLGAKRGVIRTIRKVGYALSEGGTSASGPIQHQATRTPRRG